MIPQYLEKVYAGFLGMNAGIRLGAPVEPLAWTFDKIAEIYGDITGYLKNYPNFAADDDVNGPVYFLRAMVDKEPHTELSAADVGRAWLNYARNGIGMFWWGGEGVSTEHTAYLNLKKGISAPDSGSIRQNGQVLAEQIGGQIFVDTWGLIWPGNPTKAAEYARRAASVSHDGNGLHGAAFIAACIAQAFITSAVEKIMKAGLSVIPRDSEYARVVHGVWGFYRSDPDNFRHCMKYLIENWGYDKYPGVCHIIPNAGVCVLALLYGHGDFNRTIEIATMCGWDTDCNAGNVGTIMGVACGLEGIKTAYRKPMNDMIITSGVSGYLNILDVPSYVKEVAAIGCAVAGESAAELVGDAPEGELHFDFELPGSTHGIRLSNEMRYMLRHSREQASKGTGSLEIIVDRILEADICKVYYKPFYRRHDFLDERYKPVFSPKVYSGQTVSFAVRWELWDEKGEGAIRIRPYIRKSMTQEILFCGDVLPVEQEWTTVEFTVPDTDGDCVDEVGFLIQAKEGTTSRVFGHLFLDEFRVFGDASYRIAMKLQQAEFAQITPFSFHQGTWSLEGDYLRCQSDEETRAFTGNYYTRDTVAQAQILPVQGSNHCLAVRQKGIQLGYYAGFDGENRVSIIRNQYGCQTLVSAPYSWEHGQTYQMRFEAQGQQLRLFVDEELILQTEDDTSPFGMVGFSRQDAGECLFSDLIVDAGL